MLNLSYIYIEKHESHVSKKGIHINDVHNENVFVSNKCSLRKKL